VAGTPPGRSLLPLTSKVGFESPPGTPKNTHLITMYKYIDNILSIPARLLYKDWKLMTYDTYLKKCDRGKLVRTKEGRGKGNEAYISYYDLPFEIQEFCILQLGDPKEKAIENELEEYLVPDINATKFYARYRKPNG
jgi:hypothetical protein